MTTISENIRRDFERLGEDASIFPKELLRETLEFIIKQEDIDMITRLQAKTEITKRDHGIQVLCIFPREEDEDQHWFNYTVGADRVGCPELLSFYPSAPTAHHVFNKLYQLMLDMKLELPTDPEVPVMFDNIFDNEIQIALVLLTEQQRIEAYEKYTCQVESVDVPIIHVVMPTPDGRWLSDHIPPGFLPGGTAGASLFN